MAITSKYDFTTLLHSKKPEHHDKIFSSVARANAVAKGYIALHIDDKHAFFSYILRGGMEAYAAKDADYNVLLKAEVVEHTGPIDGASEIANTLQNMVLEKGASAAEGAAKGEDTAMDDVK
jgi:hypothetical protein